MSELPPGWVQVRLADVASTQLGRMLSARRETGAHARPYLRNRDVQWGHINVANLPTMDFSPKDETRFRLASDDVLVCEGGEVGRAAIWKDQLTECYYQKALHRIRPSEALSAIYLRYLLEHYARTNAFVQLTSGSTIAHLPQEDLRNLPVSLPPRGEQERIVAAIEEQFSRVDVGAAALERVRQNLKRLRSVAFAGLADSASDWTTLGAIADVVGGVTKDAKRQSDPSYVKVPYLRVANVQRGYLDLDVVTTIRVPIDKARKLRLEAGDVLFNEGGDRDKLGRGWVWQGQIADCIHQNHVFRARLTGGAFEPKFVSMHGNTFGRDWFDRMGKQTTNLASLNLTTLKSFPVPVLPIDEQRVRVAAIEQHASLVEALDVAAKDALRRSDQLRSSILAAAFSGELTHQDPADEPASVLLEHIAAMRATSNGHKPARGRTPRTKVTT